MLVISHLIDEDWGTHKSLRTVTPKVGSRAGLWPQKPGSRLQVSEGCAVSSGACEHFHLCHLDGRFLTKYTILLPVSKLYVYDIVSNSVFGACVFLA